MWISSSWHTEEVDWYQPELSATNGCMFLAGPTLRALCSLIEHLICVSPATSSAGDVFPKVLGQTSSLCFITERSHFTAGVTVWADSQTEAKIQTMIYLQYMLGQTALQAPKLCKTSYWHFMPWELQFESDLIWLPGRLMNAKSVSQ